jgi:hypothetical protein
VAFLCRATASSVKHSQRVLFEIGAVKARQPRANVWLRFHDHIERAICAGGDLEPVRGLANKLPEHAARLAAVLTLVRDLAAPEIAQAELEAGIMLAEHYAAEALRLFGASQINNELHLAQRLLNWLLTRWPEEFVALPTIYQKSLNAIRDKATAMRLVGILEDHGWLIRVPEGAPSRGSTAKMPGEL